MLSSPYADPIAPDEAERNPESGEAYAERRLRDTPWSRRPTVVAYGRLIGFGAWLGARGVSANALTAASLVLATLSGLAVGLGHFAVAALLLVLSGACDALDGAVARATGGGTQFGALLDSTVDRLSDALPLLGVVAFYAEDGKLVLVPAAAMIAAFAVSYVRARSEALGATLPPLFMRRAERIVLLVLTLIVAPIHVQGILVRAPLLLLGVGVIGAMSVAGAWLALRSAQARLSEPPAERLNEPNA